MPVDAIEALADERVGKNRAYGLAAGPCFALPNVGENRMAQVEDVQLEALERLEIVRHERVDEAAALGRERQEHRPAVVLRRPAPGQPLPFQAVRGEGGFRNPPLQGC